MADEAANVEAKFDQYDNEPSELSADNVKLGEKVRLLESQSGLTSVSSVLSDNSLRHLDGHRQLHEMQSDYAKNMASHNGSSYELLNVNCMVQDRLK